MNRTRIKICGIRDQAMARVAAEAGADMIGLVFVERSPRFVTVDAARVIAASLPQGVEPVGLFVDAPAEQIVETAAAVDLKTVQLHGDESPEDIAALAPLRVIKSISDARQVIDFMACAHAVIFDAPPRGDALPGGTGRTFDWESLAATDRSGWPSLFVAGGLTPGNVGRAIELLRPFAVDVSSGVESRRGVKDAALVGAFCDAVHAADGSR